MFNKRSKVLFIAALLGTAYGIYIVSYFISGLGSTKGAEQAGAAIATMLVAPHMFLLWLGVLFNWLGLGMRKTGFALTGAILYCVSAFLFLPYFLFVTPSIVFGFVGYSKQKTINQSERNNSLVA